MNSINAMFSRFRRNGKQPSSQPSAPGSGSSFGSGNGGQGVPPPGGLLPNSPSSQRVAAKPLFLCKPFVTSQLVKGSFSTIVVLPKYVDQGEWLALNGMCVATAGGVPSLLTPPGVACKCLSSSTC